MSTKKSAQAQTTATEKTANVISVNLAKFKSVLDSKELDKVKKDRELIYIYPASIPIEKRNDAEGKKFRQALRNKLQRFCNNVFVYAKTENFEALQTEIATFKEFYKENFRVNDFSVKSITNSEKNEKDVALMLEIIKEVSA